MTDSDGRRADAVTALMLHHTNLVTWFVRTIGTAAVILVVPPVAGGFIGAIAEEPAWIGIGGFVSVVGLLAYLTSTSAPVPSPEIIALLGPEEGEDEPPSNV